MPELGVPSGPLQPLIAEYVFKGKVYLIHRFPTGHAPMRAKRDLRQCVAARKQVRAGLPRCSPAVYWAANGKIDEAVASTLTRRKCKGALIRIRKCP
jgi:hypothetical protein